MGKNGKRGLQGKYLVCQREGKRRRKEYGWSIKEREKKENNGGGNRVVGEEGKWGNILRNEIFGL